MAPNHSGAIGEDYTATRVKCQQFSGPRFCIRRPALTAEYLKALHSDYSPASLPGRAARGSISPRKAACRVGASDRAFRRFKAADARILNVTGRRRCQFNARSERTRDSTVLPPMRGCDAACPQAPASAAAVWAGRPLMRRLWIRPNRRSRAEPPPPKWLDRNAALARGMSIKA
jgi:hypothetical protein